MRITSKASLVLAAFALLPATLLAEDAQDVARAIRFIRQNADAYGIDPDDIAVMGFSAGGIQAGEFLMHYDETVTGAALEKNL